MASDARALHVSNAPSPFARARRFSASARAAGEPFFHRSTIAAVRASDDLDFSAFQITVAAVDASPSFTSANQASAAASVAADDIFPNARHAALRVAVSSAAMNAFQRGSSFVSARFAATANIALSDAARSKTFSPIPGISDSTSSAAAPTAPPRARSLQRSETSSGPPRTPSAAVAAAAVSSSELAVMSATAFLQHLALACARCAMIARWRHGVAPGNAFAKDDGGIASPRPNAAWRTFFALSPSTSPNVAGSAASSTRAAVARRVSGRSRLSNTRRASGAAAFASPFSTARPNAAPRRFMRASRTRLSLPV